MNVAFGAVRRIAETKQYFIDITSKFTRRRKLSRRFCANLLIAREASRLQGSFLPPYEFIFRMVSCKTQKVLRTFKSDFAWSHAIRSKGTGLQSPAPPLLKSPPAFCRANSSHRLCRMLRSPVTRRFLQTSCLRV